MKSYRARSSQVCRAPAARSYLSIDSALPGKLCVTTREDAENHRRHRTRIVQSKYTSFRP